MPSSRRDRRTGSPFQKVRVVNTVNKEEKDKIEAGDPKMDTGEVKEAAEETLNQEAEAAAEETADNSSKEETEDPETMDAAGDGQTEDAGSKKPEL